MLNPIAIPTNRDTSHYSDEERVSYLRARSIGGAINACIRAFKIHHDAILSGQFSGELIAVSGNAQDFAAIKDCARKRLFTALRKTKLEIKGRSAIHRVLEGAWPVYQALAAAQWEVEKLPAYEAQVNRALGLDLRDVTDAYSALHSLTDFVSGMTDRYAVKASELF